MTSIKKNERFVPIKNYVLAGVIVVVVILLAWYAFAWYKVVNENRISTSYLVNEKVISKELKLEEVSSVFSEPLNEYFIYVSYTGSEDVYNMEKDIEGVINQYGINDKLYYLNVTDVKDEDDFKKKINDTLGEVLDMNGKEVSTVPTIIYCKDGKVVDIINRLDNNIMSRWDFEQILDRNNVEEEE